MSKNEFKNVSFVTKTEPFKKPSKWRVLILQVAVISGAIGVALSIIGLIMVLGG